MRKIKKGDEVIVIAGKSKGKRGKILRVADAGQRVFVEAVNMVKKHVKPNPNANITGGIIDREASLDVSNVAIYNPVTNKPDRVGFRVVNGKKVRHFKSNNELIEV